MPNVMAALPNVGGALCSTPQTIVVVLTIDRAASTNDSIG